MNHRFALLAPLMLALSGCAVSGLESEGDGQTATAEEGIRALNWRANVNFDTAPDGTAIANGAVVDATYSSWGVTLSSVYCGNTSNCVPASAYARPSGNPGNGVSIIASGYAGFDARYGAVEATFATSQTQVSVDVLGTAFVEGLGTPTAKPYIAAYDAHGNFLSIVYGTLSLNTWQTLTITGSGIAKVRLSSQGVAPFVYSNFDNLQFDVVSRPVERIPLPPRPIFPLTLVP